MPQAQLSVLIPARNEERTIRKVIREVRRYCDMLAVPYEVLVISDGSVDRTEAEAVEAGADRVITGTNDGYGASLKVGAANSRAEWLLIIDADGTYPPEAIPRLWIARTGKACVVGARTGNHVAIPVSHRVAKSMVRLILFLLIGRWVPDFNSGLQVIRRDTFERFRQLYPRRFSLTTTLTVATHANHLPVWYEPIDYWERETPSQFRPVQDGLLLLLGMVVAAMRFCPWRTAATLATILGIFVLIVLQVIA